MSSHLPHPTPTRSSNPEAGFTLVAVIVAIFLVLLVLSVAAPRVAQSLRRDRELETIHRGQQYVRAIQLYYRKFGHYPGSLEQLEKSNNIRFLRRRYPDPMTGKTEWRLIHPNEAKTTLKGFFGKPLAGLPTNNFGSTPGSPAATAGSSPFGSSSPSQSPTGSPTPSFGSSGSSPSFGSSGSSPSFGSSGSTGSPGSTSSGSNSGFSGSQSPTFGSSNSGFSNPSQTSTSPGTPGSTSPGGTNANGTDPNSPPSTGANASQATGFPSQSASAFSGAGGAFVGVGTNAPGTSITVLNEQTTYPTWEFLYDPRIEQTKARVNLFGGGLTSAPTGISGSSAIGTPLSPQTPPTSPTPTPPTPTPTNPTTPPTTP